MRLLIVDDDYQIREGMRNGIEWEKIGITEIETSANGLEAMAVVRERIPDLIIADIQMPEMSGLEMIRRVREISSDIKVIFISAYSEFDYCRQALLLGANDYVLKPIEMNEFMEVIRRNISALQQEKVKDRQYQQALLAQEARKIYEKNTEADEEKFCEMLKAEFPSMQAEYFITVLIRPDNDFQNNEQQKRAAEKILQHHMEKKLVMLMETDGCLVCLSPGHNSALTTLYLQNDIKQMLIEWNHIYAEKYGSISAGISGSHGKNGFEKGFIQAYTMVERLFYCEKGEILFFDHTRMQEKNIKAAAGGKAETNEYLSERIFIEEFARQAKSSFLSPELFRRQLLEYYWGLCQKHQKIEEIDSLRSVLETCRSAQACVREVISRLEYQVWDQEQTDVQSGAYSHITQIAVRYIKKHYTEQITVAEVAREVGKSPNYFSSVFKKEMGCSFTRYLNGLRLERARWLLLQTNRQVSEIVEEIGYTDYVYFSQLFRKRFGCSATEIRIGKNTDSEK